MNKLTHLITFKAAVILLSLSLSGCSTIATIKKNNQDKKDIAETKKNHFLSLKADLTNKTLPMETPAEMLKEKYGEPDNIFNSGSSVSSFQVWTYHADKDKLAETQIDSVILYFENGKLVNWKF